MSKRAKKKKKKKKQKGERSGVTEQKKARQTEKLKK